MTEKIYPSTIKRIWMLAREYDGLAGAGGVKDVCRQLAEALARAGRSISVVLPCYGFIEPRQAGFSPFGETFSVGMDYVGTRRRETVTVWKKHEKGVRLFLLEADRFREKHSIYTYTYEEEAADPGRRQGAGHFDYFAMNVLLQKATLALITILRERPQVVHCHDGHTAILPAMIHEIEGWRHYFRNTGTVVTIHNAGYGYHQEVGDLPFAEAICELPASVIHAHLLDGKFDPLLAASPYAILNTVSENYARELQETDSDSLTGWLGHRLLERGVTLEGITNGINPGSYDPSRPETLGLPAGFSPARGDFSGKRTCKEELVGRSRHQGFSGTLQAGYLESADRPLFTMIGRLMVQKGVDVLVQALDALLAMDEDFQMLVLGTGTMEIENSLVALAENPDFRGRFCILRGYSQPLANLIYAAGDFLIIPSRYEPCGLTDFIAQLAGSLPVVHHVGGLVKVEDGVTGLAFKELTPGALIAAMSRALVLYRKRPAKLHEMQTTAVLRIHRQYTWDKVMHRYLELYETAINRAEIHR